MKKMKNNNMYIYNTLSRKKEKLETIEPNSLGLYVCGPTVYGETHLGHARPSITFDILFRYFRYLDYKVRYVRNITDVGHLENDSDDGEDKIIKKARLEQLEPMEVVQHFTNIYHENMRILNVLPPSIEPRASGHILEQLEMIDKIFENGFAYEKNGSVYFDVEKYNKIYHYGKLSGRNLEDLYNNTRVLEGQSEKKNPYDFALWKKANPEHIMRWSSKWSEGFPGWHLECSAMSEKYLGEKFDIHGGGIDLLFPHHECEIAQTKAANGKEAVKYWVHNNLITINGKKMGKSLGNFITLKELFTGKHKVLEQSYSPMTIRFFILQAHYRSTLDFSNEALKSSEKGLKRLMDGIKKLENLQISEKSSFDVNELEKKCLQEMNDDLSTPKVISHLFDGLKIINKIILGNEKISSEDLKIFKKTYHNFTFKILGLKKEEEKKKKNNEDLSKLMDLILNLRLEEKSKRNWEISDKIRNELNKIGFEIKDKKDGFEWKKR